MFAAPASTRFDLHFRLAGVAVRVHPLFWLVAVVLGASGGDPVVIVLWVVVVFVSILIHEFGHALAFRAFGTRSHIVLYGMGGLTVPESVAWGSTWALPAFSTRQKVIVSAAGAAAGFAFAAIIALAGLGLATAGVSAYRTPLVQTAMGMLLWVNVVWGLVNLAPVLPLDGGEIARSLLESADPVGGLRKALWLSAIAGGIIAGLAALTGNLFAAFLFGILALSSAAATRGPGMGTPM
jgi:stage IV sporulation protein FB